MTITQRWNRLTTHFSERIAVVKRRMSVFPSFSYASKKRNTWSLIQLCIRLLDAMLNQVQVRIKFCCRKEEPLLNTCDVEALSLAGPILQERSWVRRVWVVSWVPSDFYEVHVRGVFLLYLRSLNFIRNQD